MSKAELLTSPLCWSGCSTCPSCIGISIGSLLRTKDTGNGQIVGDEVSCTRAGRYEVGGKGFYLANAARTRVATVERKGRGLADSTDMKEDLSALERHGCFTFQGLLAYYTSIYDAPHTNPLPTDFTIFSIFTLTYH
ncbi:hypothetical protein CBL_11488 [Carabus blaptoides fortunei]